MKKFIHKYDISTEIFKKKFNTISIDTETMGLDMNRDRLCVVQLMIDEQEIHIIHFPKPDYKAPNLKKLLQDKESIKIFHFARFDVFMIFKYLKVKMKNIVCTRILSKITRTYSDRHGLKELCRELLGKDMNKHAQSSNWGAEELTQSQIDYAANDVIYLPAIFNKLKEMCVMENRYHIAKEAFNVINSIIFIEYNLFNPVTLIEH
jgi:ribonuclease D